MTGARDEDSGASAAKSPDVGGSTDAPSPEGAEVGPARCRCGHTRDHVMVSAVPVYTGWAKFWVFFMGVSYKPVALDFQCRVCKDVFDHTEDPRALAGYL